MMDTKPPTRTLPKLVMKEWPGVPLKEGRLEVTSLATGEGRSYAIKDGKILSDFTLVVEETGVLDQERSQKDGSRHD